MKKNRSLKAQEATIRNGLNNKGKKRSEEWKKARSVEWKKRGIKPPSTLGKKHTSETKKKIGEAQLGEKNHNWKGGATEKHQEIRNSSKYKLWRTDIFERDGFICQMPGCDKSEHYLEAHHIKKFSDNSTERFDNNNGITLCKKCHNKTKTRESKFEIMFHTIIKTRI